MRSAVMLMQRTAPGLLPVYMSATGIPTDDPRVTVRAGVDGGSPVLEYNVDFVVNLEPSLLGSIVYMQCLKIALHHCDKRRKEPLDMLKLASDVVVAEYARKVVDTSVGRNLEILNRLFPSYWNYWPILQKHGFVPETDLTLEKLFDIFREEYATMKPEESEEESEEEEGERPEDNRPSDTKNKPEASSGKDGRKTGEEKQEDRDGNGTSGESDSSGEDTGKEGKEDSVDGEGDGDRGKDGDSGEGESGEGQPDPGDSGESEGEQERCEGNDTESDSSQPGDGGDGSSGEGADGGSTPGENPGDDAPGEGDAGDDSSGDDTGNEGDSGTPSSDAPGEGTGDEPKDDFERMSKYFSLTNVGNDLARWGQDDMARDSTTSKILDAMDKGMFDRMRGPLPVMLRDANRVKVDREAMFRKFMSSVQDDEFVQSWSRRNRKYRRYGMISPGNLYEETQRILFCIDVSGSMYQGDAIRNCLTVMENVVDGLSVDIVYWDAVCSPVFSTPRSIKEMAIYGGGMTDPDCVLRKLGPERYKYDGLIFLTDCMFSWREPPRPRQIMILRTHGKYDFPDWCLFRDELESFIGK